jgi:hypothetical protein
MRALGLKLLDDGEEVADRAGETVEPDDDQATPDCGRRRRMPLQKARREIGA